jgi:hypothetical protein
MWQKPGGGDAGRTIMKLSEASDGVGDWAPKNDSELLDVADQVSEVISS